MNFIFSTTWAEENQTNQLFVFWAVFGILALAEWKRPRRPSLIPKNLRWTHNLAVTLLNFLILRFLFPGAALLAASQAANFHFGFFNWVELPPGFDLFWTFIILDITVYYQHRAFHSNPLLWKIHRVHHADLEVDVTTGARFHPLELVVSLLIKSTVILFFGLPVFAVFLFEAALMLSSLWNHSNLRLPKLLDKILRLVVVTPDLHRTHHSADMSEANSDFGFIFSFWDKLFGTYLAEPKKGPLEMKIGLDVFNGPPCLTGDRILLMPFMDKEGRCAWNQLWKKD